MNGLVSDYYNLTGQKNINIDNITLTGKFQGSNSKYYYGITSNIQEQINKIFSLSGGFNNTIINYISSSGQILSNISNIVNNNYSNQNIINTNIYGSISGAVFNISNIINNNQIYNNNINNYLTYYINSISGTILTINNNLNNTINNNVTNQNTINNNIYGSISGSLISIYNTINSNIINQNIINNNLYQTISGIIYNIPNYQPQLNGIRLDTITLSGLIYNIPNYQPQLNNIGLSIMSLSGLIFLKAARGEIGPIGPQGNSIKGDTGNTGPSGRDGTGGVASGGSIGAIVNGIASLGLGAAIAFIASSLTAAITLLQAQIVSIIAELSFANFKIWGLQTNTIAMQSQITSLIAQSAIQDTLIAELQAKGACLDGNVFTGRLLIFGNIEQTLGFSSNIFLSEVIIESNLIVYGGIQSGRDFFK